MKLQAAYETEVYIGDTGYIVIKQKGPVTEEDSIVFFSVDQAKKLLLALPSLIEEAEAQDVE